MIEKELKNRIEQKLKVLNKNRPLPKSILEKLREQLEIEMTYNSNGIEGNTLSLRETQLILEEGITVKNRSLREHLEVKSHSEALDYLFKIIDDKGKLNLTEKLIKELHYIVMGSIDKDWAGRYRNGSVFITGSKHQPPEAIGIPSLIQASIKQYKSNKKQHPIERAAYIHHAISHIHPFYDGNGRAARLIMNIALLGEGYPLSYILKNDRKKYYR